MLFICCSNEACIFYPPPWADRVLAEVSNNPLESSQPNIVFLLTDDQDVTEYFLDYMPKLNKLL